MTSLHVICPPIKISGYAYGAGPLYYVWAAICYIQMFRVISKILKFGCSCKVLCIMALVGFGAGRKVFKALNRWLKITNKENHRSFRKFVRVAADKPSGFSVAVSTSPPSTTTRYSRRSAKWCRSWSRSFPPSKTSSAASCRYAATLRAEWAACPLNFTDKCVTRHWPRLVLSTLKGAATEPRLYADVDYFSAIVCLIFSGRNKICFSWFKFDYYVFCSHNLFRHCVSVIKLSSCIMHVQVRRKDGDNGKRKRRSFGPLKVAWLDVITHRQKLTGDEPAQAAVLFQNSTVEKAFLFDVVSKIYIATDGSAVDMQSYELCCEMIDVMIDMTCIYGWVSMTSFWNIFVIICLSLFVQANPEFPDPVGWKVSSFTIFQRMIVSGEFFSSIYYKYNFYFQIDRFFSVGFYSDLNSNRSPWNIEEFAPVAIPCSSCWNWQLGRIIIW